MPTRVTPSMSLRAARKAAVPSWPSAQPWITSEGPAIDASGVLEVELALADAAVGRRRLPVMFSRVTFGGITSASSFSTRSQSKRLWARLLTVCVRASSRLAKFA